MSRTRDPTYVERDHKTCHSSEWLAACCPILSFNSLSFQFVVRLDQISYYRVAMAMTELT